MSGTSPYFKAKDLRIPPQSIEAEKALLGSVMIRPEVMHDITDIIFDRSFYSDRHKLIWITMMELYSKGTPIDLLSLSSRLKEKDILEQAGDVNYLTELVNGVPSSTNAKHYAEIIQKKHIMRDLINASEFVGELGFDEAGELDELLDKAEKRIFEVTNFTGTHKFIALKDTLTEAWERIDRLHNTKDELRGIPTGFRGLDNKLAGLQKSDLIILAARPSMGKTSLALDIARKTAIDHNIPVGIFSLEMSSQQLVDRMLSAESQVDAWKLRTGHNLSIDHDFKAIRDAMDRLSNAPIYIDDQPANNILKMRAVARRLKSEKGLGLIVVDYLQLMVPTQARHSDNMVQQVTEISRSLKQMARELEVPVLALSQLSRAVEQRGGEPRLSDLRDSGCLTGDTKIIRADTGERICIKDLVGHENVPVFAIDEKYKIINTLATKIFPSGKKEIFSMQTRSGRIIKASSNHKFFTLSGWKRLDELKGEMRIALPRFIPETEKVKKIDNNEIILLAHLLGDGCVLPKQPIHYTSADKENLAIVEETAKSLFGIEARRIKQENWWHIYLPSPYRLARGKKHPITIWFERLGIKPVRSYEKEIPNSFFEIGEQQICLFLHHLWATDGNISWKILEDRKPSASIYYASTSEELASGVQHLLLKLGIWSNIKKVLQNKYRPIYQIHIQSAPVQIKFLELIGSFGERGKIVNDLKEKLNNIVSNPNTDTIPKEIWKSLIETEKDKADMSWRDLSEGMKVSYNGTALMSTGISRERLTTVATALSSDVLLHIAESDIYWDEIISIKSNGIEEVFDATVPNYHNFLANDFIVHNSIEQDADVVMFIHREDKYNKDSAKPNIAKIMIEKHRNGPTGTVELFFDEKKTTFITVDKSDFGDFDKGIDNTGNNGSDF
ncbi:MAG TPA: replicative DNA helicase [Candidatus Paceibacterota bacterium]